MKFAMNLCLHARKKVFIDNCKFNNNPAIGLMIEYFVLCLKFKYCICGHGYLLNVYRLGN